MTIPQRCLHHNLFYILHYITLGLLYLILVSALKYLFFSCFKIFIKC